MCTRENSVNSNKELNGSYLIGLLSPPILSSTHKVAHIGVLSCCSYFESLIHYYIFGVTESTRALDLKVLSEMIFFLCFFTTCWMLLSTPTTNQHVDGIDRRGVTTGAPPFIVIPTLISFLGVGKGYVLGVGGNGESIPEASSGE